MPNLKISIITVSYNAQETIEDTLKSVLGQSYNNVEHIVIDGASSDSTVDIIKKYEGNIAHFISEPDKGIYDAMNKGLSLASGEVVGFLNADDVYVDHQVLSNIANAFIKHSMDACYSDLVYVDPNNLDKVIRYWKSSSYAHGLFAKGWCPPHPTFFVKRDIYEKYGYFDINYKIGNDVELMMRFLAKHMIKSKYLPGVTIKMRTGGVSNRRIIDVVKQNLEIIKAARSNGIVISPVYFLIYKILSRFTQFRVRSKIALCENK